MPSSSQDKEARGLLLKQASIWVKTVVSSLKVNLALALTCVKCVLLLLTVASHRPPKCGVLSGMKTQLIF